MATSEKHNRSIDYAAAAAQLIAVLAAFAPGLPPSAPGEDPPVPARTITAPALCRLVFRDECRFWTHETRRRRIRQAAIEARHILTRDQSPAQICADSTHGYWLSSDPGQIARYAALRRRHGLRHLAAASQVKTAAPIAAGQTSLLPAPTDAACECGHAWTAHSSAGCHGFRCTCQLTTPPRYDLFAPIPKPEYRH